MTAPTPDDPTAWLDALLERSAAPSPPDDDFSAGVMQRIDTLATAAAAAVAVSPAHCVAPAAALNRLSAATRRERRWQACTAAGVIAAAGIGLITLWAQPAPATALALMLASAALPLLLLRDPRF